MISKDLTAVREALSGSEHDTNRTIPGLVALAATFADEGRFSEDYEPGAVRNAYRASLTVPALLAFIERVGRDTIQSAIDDLIADLAHLSDLVGEDDVSESNANWQTHYYAEKAGE